MKSFWVHLVFYIFSGSISSLIVKVAWKFKEVYWGWQFPFCIGIFLFLGTLIGLGLLFFGGKK